MSSQQLVTLPETYLVSSLKYPTQAQRGRIKAHS